MAKKNSTAPKKAMIFNSVLMINTENVVSLANSLPKCRMSEDSFNLFMKNKFYFGGKFHGNDFNEGSHYSTVVRQLGLYHILDNEYIPRFYSNINEQEAESYLRYWLKLYVAPNPTSQANFRKSVVVPKYFLKELILFVDKNPMIKNIYDIVDKIFDQEFSRNDKGNLPNIIKKYSDCIEVDDENNVSLKPNYKQVMMDINELINNPNRYFEHFGGCKKTPSINVSGQPLQQIFYGAPGTGKSNTIKREVDEKELPCIRTTFHPDSDYSTFVGAYKPIMEDIDVKVTPVVAENGISPQPSGTYKERRIAYKFVKQAFLKAYLGAWKKYVDSGSIGNTYTSNEFDTGNGRYVINSVGVYNLNLSKEFTFPKSLVTKEWDNLWNDGIFNVPKGQQSGKSVQHAIANWITNKIDDCNKDKFEEGWQKLSDTIREKGRVEVQKSRTYIICGISDDNETLTINVEAQGKSKAKLRPKFNDDKTNASKLEKALIEILKKYDTDFDVAWDKLKKTVDEGTSPEVKDDSDGYIVPQFLVIEEINRGNCAQIFGDIFQLLDRQENGFSEYPIEADTDIQNAIKTAFEEEKEYKLESNIDVDFAIEDYTSNYDAEATLSEDVQAGRVMLLPPNLYIWATMNTSDQSLFPIDSAFKRRWDWVYIPICYDEKTQDGKENKAYHFKITINGRDFSWINFLRVVNLLVKNATDSEDKQMGNFFIKHNVKEKEFISKVMYYLWSEVCKDNFGSRQNFFRKEDDKEFSFNELFDDKDHQLLLSFMKRLQKEADVRDELKDKGIVIEKDVPAKEKKEEPIDTQEESE